MRPIEPGAAGAEHGSRTDRPSFQRHYQAYVKRIDDALHRLLPPVDAWPQLLHEGMRYCVFGGGKRLRPVLLLAAGELVGGEDSALLPPACAVELIHTYSLVHDDLPAMDDDAFRRGRPTAHRIYGEALAILIGDALLTEAFRCLASPSWNVSDRIAREVAGELAEGAGSRGLIAGQVEDLAGEGVKDADPTVWGERLERIHRHKTGRLFVAAARMGALAGGATPGEVVRLGRFAEHLGLAFQIVDDLLDGPAGGNAKGRPAGSDVRKDKLTFPQQYGSEEAKQRAREETEKALAELEAFGERAWFLRRLAEFSLHRGG